MDELNNKPKIVVAVCQPLRRKLKHCTGGEWVLHRGCVFIFTENRRNLISMNGDILIVDDAVEDDCVDILEVQVHAKPLYVED